MFYSFVSYSLHEFFIWHSFCCPHRFVVSLVFILSSFRRGLLHAPFWSFIFLHVYERFVLIAAKLLYYIRYIDLQAHNFAALSGFYSVLTVALVAIIWQPQYVLLLLFQLGSCWFYLLMFRLSEHCYIATVYVCILFNQHITFYCFFLSNLAQFSVSS